MITQKCVYCTEAQGTTKDHVPPKSFFPEPRPANLITVPSCKKCNSGAAMDDNYLLATLMFSDAGKYGRRCDPMATATTENVHERLGYQEKTRHRTVVVQFEKNKLDKAIRVRYT